MRMSDKSLEEQLPEVPSNGRNCRLCIHQKVCGILPLFANTIEVSFPEAIKTTDLAWICKMYKEVEV